MNYLEDMAARIRAAVPDESVPDDADALFLMYAILALAKGTAVRRSDVHNAWSAWMTIRGEKHDAIRPLGSLPEDVRAEDDPFVTAIHAVAKETPDSS